MEPTKRKTAFYDSGIPLRKRLKNFNRKEYSLECFNIFLSAVINNNMYN